MKLKTRNTNLAQIVIVKSDEADDSKKIGNDDQHAPSKEPEQEKQEDKS